jgi:WD40 repeat protein
MQLLKTISGYNDQLVNTIKFLTNGNLMSYGGYFVVGYQNGLIKIFDISEMNLIAELQAHSRSITGLVCHTK